MESQSQKPYKTLSTEGTCELTIQKSVFIGAAFPAPGEQAALNALATVRARWREISHHCYAYVIGKNAGIQRYSDGGEPSGAAGQPILSVLTSQGIVDAVVIVTRWFGGIKLGAGGLHRAYTQAAAEAVAAARPALMQPSVRLMCAVSYALNERIDYLLQSAPCIVEKKDYAGDVTFTLCAKAADYDALTALITNAAAGACDIIPVEEIWMPW